MTSKNPQLDASTESLEKSKEYLALVTEKFLEGLTNLDIPREEKMNLDKLVKQIQHYTYRVALSNISVQTAKTLQSVYLGCGDPTGSKEFWAYDGERRLADQTA
jgi:hypothetical protein